MLPLFRLIPVGGVFLAIAILLLALNPPRGTSPSARATLMPAHGALIDRAAHPEWRQFLIQAALRRAGEVERLRDLHDTVIIRTEAAPAQPVAPVVVATLAPVTPEAEATRRRRAGEDRRTRADRGGAGSHRAATGRCRTGRRRARICR